MVVANTVPKRAEAEKGRVAMSERVLLVVCLHWNEK
jgi:hypothetical protein